MAQHVARRAAPPSPLRHVRARDRPIFAERFRVGAHGRRREHARHEHAVLTFALSGRVRMEQDGVWTLEAGDVLVIPAGAPHRMLEDAAHDDAEVWGVGFCVPCLAAGAEPALLAPFARVRAGGAAVVRVPSARRAFVEALLAELAEATGARPAPQAVQRSLLTLVLHEVERAAVPSGAAGVAAGVAAEALTFIEQNCLRPLTLAEVARAVGRTPAHVTTSLSRATGRSAVAWIIAGRMAEARRLLLHSDEPVDDVAARVGYADSTHFIRMFRREHGVTPTAWRAAQRAQLRS